MCPVIHVCTMSSRKRALAANLGALISRICDSLLEWRHTRTTVEPSSSKIKSNSSNVFTAEASLVFRPSSCYSKVSRNRFNLRRLRCSGSKCVSSFCLKRYPRQTKEHRQPGDATSLLLFNVQSSRYVRRLHGDRSGALKPSKHVRQKDVCALRRRTSRWPERARNTSDCPL